jgi:hypothetical protein
VENREGESEVGRPLGVGGVREMSELTWQPDMWDPTPHQRKPFKTSHESVKGG